MNAFRKKTKEGIKNFQTFLKWVWIALTIGITVGAVGTLFHFFVEWATEFRMEHQWIVWFLPVGGLMIILFYRAWGVKQAKGTNFVLMSIHSNETLPLKMAPLIFVSTVITHFFGGSSGREGAALQLGGSIATQFGKWYELDEKDMKVIVMCGMSAAFAALFRTPLASAVFAIEVVTVGVMYYAALVPCVMSAVIGYLISGVFGVPETSFVLVTIPQLTALSIGQVLILSTFCAALSILFCMSLQWTAKGYEKFFRNQYIRVAIGGILVASLAHLIGNTDYLGAGMDVIERAVCGSGNIPTWDFLFKIVFTALTLEAGFKGGEIVPSFFIGATFGNVIGGMLGLNPAFGAAIGLMAVFCGVTNCPITALIIAIELFGVGPAIFFLMATAVSYMLSGYYGLYSKQRIIYSKTRTELLEENEVGKLGM